MAEQNWQFEHEGLVISASRAAKMGTLAFRGVSDSRNPSAFLVPVLRELCDKMRGAEVTLDFSSLEYMNSATVSPLINFVKSLDGVAKRVSIVYSDVDWQRTHMQCMRTIARTLKNVSVDTKPSVATI